MQSLGKKQKWSTLFDSLQKDFIQDLEKSFNRITTTALDKCASHSTNNHQLTCTQEVDRKMKELLQRFQKDLDSSLNKLEQCFESADNSSGYIGCISKSRNEIQKEGLMLLDALKLRVN